MTLKEIAYESDASQDGWELWRMLQFISELNPTKILEIGVHTGNGLKAFHKAFPKAKLYGIESETQFLHFKDFELFEGDSKDSGLIDKVRQAGPYDFIFIDGDHTYEGVRADWNNYKGMVRPGGAVGFHDTSRMGEGWMSKVEVRKLLDELSQDYTYKTVEIWNGRNNPGVAIIWP